MEALFLLALILLNGVFAMSEIALVTARRGRLQKQVEEGDRAAAAALELGEHPTRFLSTVQIGITSIGILSGIVGEALLAAPLAMWLQEQSVEKELSEGIATAIVVIVITYVAIVLGELVPKRLGQINPEPIARLVARPMLALAALTRPFVRLLSVSTELMLRLCGVRADRLSAVTEEDIHSLLEESSTAGVIERDEQQMVRNLFRLDDRPITSLMVPRGEVDYLDLDDPLEENLRKMRETRHSRWPVCRGGMDGVVGIATARLLLSQTLRGEKLSLNTELRPVVFVPDTLSGLDLLAHFRATDVQLALVVNEYGEIQGLVTLQDVLEAITGEFAPQRTEDAWAVQREDGSWLLDGLIPVPELKDRLGLRILPEEGRGSYNTLAGMLMLLLDRVPRTGDQVDWDGWRYEIVDMDQKRIDKVLARTVPQAHGDA